MPQHGAEPIRVDPGHGVGVVGQVHERRRHRAVVGPLADAEDPKTPPPLTDNEFQGLIRRSP